MAEERICFVFYSLISLSPPTCFFLSWLLLLIDSKQATGKWRQSSWLHNDAS